jgi:dihydroxyacetone kinase
MSMTTKTRVDDSGLDILNPDSTTARDATHFRAIIAASEAVDAAESELRAAVREAREAGDSWTVIGAALGVSKQAAQQRFARV